jgi:acyl transferase domain-containing protein
VDLSQTGSTHDRIQQLDEELEQVSVQDQPSSTSSSTGTPDDSHEPTRASSPLTTEVLSSSASSLSLDGQDVDKTSRKGILPLSAADEDGPARVARGVSDYLKTDIGRTHDLKDVLHTLSANRTHHPWRTFGVVDQSGVFDLVVGETLAPAVRAGHIAPLLHFLFTGQGAQWARMGLDLLQFKPFHRSLEQADTYLRQELGCEWSLMRQLELTADTGSKIGQPALAQPLTTALQVALVDLMRSWDVIPTSVTGHSSGEIAAAYCAGALSCEEAWTIAYFRGVVSEKLASNTQRPKSGMMSVGLGAEKAQAYLDEEGVADRVSVACINSPINVTISGQADALDIIYQRLEKDELFVRRLAVQVAYHNSKVMSEVADEYEQMLSRAIVARPAKNQDSRVTFFSSVMAGRLTELDELRTPSYWVRNLVSPVHFSDAIGSVVQESAALKSVRNSSHFFVEIGPQAALRRPVQDTLKAISKEKYQYINTLDAKKDDVSCLLGALGQLWCAGVDIDLARVNRSCFITPTALEGKAATTEPRVIADLPSYPFSRARLDWAESRLSKGFAFRPHRRHALLGLPARDWNPNEASWRHIIRHAENPWIVDHTVNGSSVYPGAGIIVMAIEAARQMTESQQQSQSQEKQQRIVGYRVADVRFLRSISVDTSERGNEAQLHMRQRRDNINNTLQKWYDWRVFTMGSADEWLEAAHGSIKVEVETIGSVDEASRRRQQRESDRLRAEHDRITDSCKYKTYPDQMYGNIRAHGMDYGPYFARLSDITYNNDGRAAASVTTRDYSEKMEYANEDPCVIHPTTLDALCHLQMVSVSAGGLRSMPAMMFTHCREMWISNKLFELPGNLKLLAATTETMRGFRECECDTVALLAETREPMVIIRGERGTAITSLDHDADAEPIAACYQLAYQADLSLMTNDETYKFLMNNTFRDFSLPDKNCLDRVDAMVNYYVDNTLQRLEKEGFPHSTDHLAQYIQWMKRQNAQKSNQKAGGYADVDVEALLLAEPAEPTEGLVRRVGQNLHEILTGKANALQILFEGTLMQGK